MSLRYVNAFAPELPDTLREKVLERINGLRSKALLSRPKEKCDVGDYAKTDGMQSKYLCDQESVPTYTRCHHSL